MELGEIWNFNLLILDRVEILPKYRGGGVGLLVLTALIERFGAGAGVVGMKPFPLQFEPHESRDSSGWAKRLRLDDLPRDEKMAKKKLKRYYGKLGFLEMKSTPFMFRSMAWELSLLSSSCVSDNIDRFTIQIRTRLRFLFSKSHFPQPVPFPLLQTAPIDT